MSNLTNRLKHVSARKGWFAIKLVQSATLVSQNWIKYTTNKEKNVNALLDLKWIEQENAQCVLQEASTTVRLISVNAFLITIERTLTARA